MLVGEWIAGETVGRALKIALISGEQGNEVGQERRLGVLAGLLEGQLRAGGAARYEIVGRGWGAWINEGGLKAMEDILTAHPDVNLVLGENDSMVLGARKALEAAGRTADVLLVAAADGQKEAIEMIRAGRYGATGLDDPNLIASTAVDLARQAVDGTLPAGLSKVTHTTPAVITKNNADQYYKADSVF